MMFLICLLAYDVRTASERNRPQQRKKRLQLFSAANTYFFCLTAFSGSNTCFFRLMFFPHRGSFFSPQVFHVS